MKTLNLMITYECYLKFFYTNSYTYQLKQIKFEFKNKFRGGGWTLKPAALIDSFFLVGRHAAVGDVSQARNADGCEQERYGPKERRKAQLFIATRTRARARSATNQRRRRHAGGGSLMNDFGRPPQIIYRPGVNGFSIELCVRSVNEHSSGWIPTDGILWRTGSGWPGNK